MDYKVRKVERVISDSIDKWALQQKPKVSKQEATSHIIKLGCKVSKIKIGEKHGRPNGN